MKIKNRELRVPIMLNLIILLAIYGDLINPFNKIYSENFKAIYHIVEEVPRVKGGGGKDVKAILECQSGNLYHLGEIPSELSALQNGQQISITKSLFLSKAYLLTISPKDNKLNISFLLIFWISIGSILSFLIATINCFFKSIFLDILLYLSSGYIFFLTIIYLIYF